MGVLLVTFCFVVWFLLAGSGFLLMSWELTISPNVLSHSTLVDNNITNYFQFCLSPERCVEVSRKQLQSTTVLITNQIITNINLAQKLGIEPTSQPAGGTSHHGSSIATMLVYRYTY
jgi:hypothetical protein